MKLPIRLQHLLGVFQRGFAELAPLIMRALSCRVCYFHSLANHAKEWGARRDKQRLRRGQFATGEIEGEPQQQGLTSMQKSTLT